MFLMDEQKKTIMFVVPTLVGGGAEKTVANLSRYLTRYYNVIIVVLDDTKQKYSYGGRLIVLKTVIRKGLFGKFFSRIARARELKKIKTDNNISCSISFLLQADLLNVLSKGKERCIVSIRNNDAVLFKNGPYGLIVRYCLKHCDLIVSISEQVRKNLIATFKIAPKKITTIYNPCLTIEFKKGSSTVNPAYFSNFFTFINVARLTDQKGQWHLIRSFKVVAENYPEAKLIILGKGELEGYLKQLISDLGLEKNVTMLGFVDNPYDYLQKSDVFVFSSLFEGLGNSILEAMSYGLPIISTDCDYGPRELLSSSDNIQRARKTYVKAKYGVLCPAFDDIKYSASDQFTDQELEYAKAMMLLIENRKIFERYCALSKERAKSFDINIIANKWREVIDD